VGKYLFLLVIVLLVGWWIAKRYRQGVDARDAAAPRGDEDMVRCAQCGIHLPRSEGLVTRGRYYCSAEHQRQHSLAD
jgi:uncharacterized protein